MKKSGARFASFISDRDKLRPETGDTEMAAQYYRHQSRLGPEGSGPNGVRLSGTRRLSLRSPESEQMDGS